MHHGTQDEGNRHVPMRLCSKLLMIHQLGPGKLVARASWLIIPRHGLSIYAPQPTARIIPEPYGRTDPYGSGALVGLLHCGPKASGFRGVVEVCGCSLVSVSSSEGFTLHSIDRRPPHPTTETPDLKRLHSLCQV